MRRYSLTLYTYTATLLPNASHTLAQTNIASKSNISRMRSPQARAVGNFLLECTVPSLLFLISNAENALYALNVWWLVNAFAWHGLVI